MCHHYTGYLRTLSYLLLTISCKAEASIFEMRTLKPGKLSGQSGVKLKQSVSRVCVLNLGAEMFVSAGQGRVKCPEDTELGHPFEGPGQDKEKAEEVRLWRKTQKDRRTSKESYIMEKIAQPQKDLISRQL